MRAVACCLFCCRLLILVLSVRITLSIETMIALRISASDWSMSMTRGFCVLEFDTRLLRWSSRLLYSEICDSMLPPSMPELAGSSWVLLASLVR